MASAMTINGYPAKVVYDDEIEMFRGEFLGLNGGADFYAEDVKTLRKEGELSLQVFLEECERQGIEPHKHYSGNFRLRIDPEIHRQYAIDAAAAGDSLNESVTAVLQKVAELSESMSTSVSEALEAIEAVMTRQAASSAARKVAAKKSPGKAPKKRAVKNATVAKHRLKPTRNSASA